MSRSLCIGESFHHNVPKGLGGFVPREKRAARAAVLDE